MFNKPTVHQEIYTVDKSIEPLVKWLNNFDHKRMMEFGMKIKAQMFEASELYHCDTVLKGI